MNKQLTVRNIPPELLSAMDVRKRQLGVSRDVMLQELFLKEFAHELAWLRVSVEQAEVARPGKNQEGRDQA